MNRKNFKVFVVDDDPILGNLIYKAIQNSEEACDVLIFQNSADFFSAFYHNKVQVAIIDDDLNEADVDGLYILNDIVKRGGDVKVIALSGSDSVDKVLQYMDGGAWKYLSKSDKLWPEKIENYVREAILDAKRSRLLDNVNYEHAIDLVLKKDELLSSFFNRFPALFAILDRNGKFQMANDKWSEQLGWSKFDLRHLSIKDIACENCFSDFDNCFENNTTAEFKCEVKTKDGDRIEIDWQIKQNNDNFFCLGRL